MTVQAAAMATPAVTVTTGVGFAGEYVGAILPPLTQAPQGGDNLMIKGHLNITPGASSTAIVVRVRAGTTVAGALVGLADTVGVAAALPPMSVPFGQLVADATAALQAADLGAQWCVTYQVTGAAAASNLNDGIIFADEISDIG